uniref:Uncharacterized protein n=1 Tax=Arundo donax TaxID=35708 RepID=A0A0A8ZU10_ARUDO
MNKVTKRRGKKEKKEAQRRHYHVLLVGDLEGKK